MKLKIWTSFFILSLFGIAVGCSDAGFESLPKRTCDDNVDRDTVCKADELTNTYSFSFRIGDVDILFVDDNSGSMSPEQAKMANAFPNFLNRISNLFYNIAIITTDVSASPNNNVAKAANGYGAYQDGKFLTFVDATGTSSGLNIIKNETANREELFRNTIQRKETLNCDANNYASAHCPSNDERGIYAANLAIERGDSSFFRSGAHLAIVVLTDEDERGTAGYDSAGNPNGKPLEAKDLPETLVLNMARLYPTKSFSTHAVMVKPGDSSCLSNQGGSATNPWLKGSYGHTYAQLTNPSVDLFSLGNIMPGVKGSICASDYGAQLGDIGQNIQNNTMNSPKKLNCNPETSTIELTTVPTGYESQVDYAIDSQDRVYFENVPIGVQVNFVYKCSRF